MNRRGFLGVIASATVLARYGYAVAKSAIRDPEAADFCGDGSDGNILLDGRREFAFATLDRATKTYKFTRSVHAQNLSIMPGVTLNLSIWPLYVADTFDYTYGEVVNLPRSAIGGAA